jgi:sec-independent protein translocase protein TatB
MFGSIGGAEIVMVLLLALLLFGPRRIPQIGRMVGKALSEFRKATTDFKMNLEREVDLTEVREVHEGLKSTGKEISDTVGELRRTSVTPPAPTADVEEDRDS